MFPAKAKSVIFIFCYGGPSQVDAARAQAEHGTSWTGRSILVKTFGRGGHKSVGRVVGPKWQFKPYGRCGKLVSDLFPHVGGCADDIAFVHSHLRRERRSNGSRHSDDEQRAGSRAATRRIGGWGDLRASAA